MKKLIIISIAFLSIFACTKPDVIPEDLEGKKKYLSKQKTELLKIQAKINEVTEQIETLEPKKINTALVSLDTLETSEFNQYVEVQAMVVAEDYVNAASETGGRLLSLNVKEGQYVKRGALIATVDLESIENQLKELETSYDLAKTVFEKRQRLWDQQIGSELQYLEAKNTKERLEKSIETIQSNLKKKNVYAPISGYVDREFTQAGEMSAPGSPIVSILNASKVKIVADLPEKYLGTIKKGDLVEIEFPALQKNIKEKISLLGRSIDPSNRTLKVEINTNNRNGELKPNLLAKVLFNNYNKKDALVVSSDLVQQDVAGKKFVYLAQQQDTSYIAKQAYIQTGESYDNQIEITEGIEAGAIVIVDGARSLVDGSIIEFK